MLDALRKFTSLPRQRLCMLQARGGSRITVAQRDGGAVFGDLIPCGLRSCPNCGPIIQAQRREQIGEAVAASGALGWTVLFTTLTLSHSKEDRLADTFEAITASWRAMTRGGWWNRLRKRYGLRHWVRVIECKQGGAHGWHPHLHVLLFFDPAAAAGPMDVPDFASVLTGRWSLTVQATGYTASLAAQKVLEPTDQHLDVMAGYFTKEMSADIAWEMTDAGGKADRKGTGSRSPSELLLVAAGGDEEAQHAWREYEDVTKGRQLIATSAHLRLDLRLPDPEPADQHVRAVTEASEAAATPLVTLDPREWEDRMSHFGEREELAIVVGAATSAEEVLWWLQKRGWKSMRLAPAVEPPAPPAPPIAGPAHAPWLAEL